MKQNVSYGWGSFWSFIFWCFLIFIVFWWIWTIPAGSSAGAESGSYSSWWWWLLIFICVWWLCDIIFYIPVGVSANDDYFRVRRALNSTKVPMSDIESARVYSVNGKAQRGVRISPAAFSAKWGTFNDPEIGDYVAYYSNPKKTVLITLKNGEKLVVGSKDPKALADYINSKVK